MENQLTSLIAAYCPGCDAGAIAARLIDEYNPALTFRKANLLVKHTMEAMLPEDYMWDHTWNATVEAIVQAIDPRFGVY